MTEAEFLELVDAWALGGLSEVERARMERYWADQPSAAAQAAHQRAFAIAALLAAAEPPSPPPPAVWDRVEASLPALANGVTDRVRPARSRAAMVGWVVAAAAAILLVVLWRDRRGHVEREAALDRELRAQAAPRSDLDACKRDLDAIRARDALAGEAVALLELPGTQLIPLDRHAGATTGIAANAIYHRGVKKAYVVAAGLPIDAPPDGYRVWLVRAGHRVAAGVLVPDHGRAIVSVPTLTLDDGVPETFQIALATGEIVLESQIKI